ncbi:MAG TPA: cyclic nucleotide-binding and patatin-like phospholipase domain-containing protein, partial [Terriglobales bacterium]|nr:cyclic nucleotide-binding and patatin-like phospholipase domain-containing protein [Terriglobales bacterium]
MFPPHKLFELSNAPILQAVDNAALEDLLPELEWVHLAGGQTLFRAGESGDSMYIVIAGRLRISMTGSNGAEEILREIGPGESVGELALLTGNPRSATVRAIRDSILARFSRGAFDAIVRHHPDAFSRLTAQIAGRQSLGKEGGTSRRNIRTLAILPLDSELPVHDFIRKLIEALQPIGPTHHLASGTQAIENDQSASRLSELETDHRFLIYEADTSLSPWTELCMRQADLILLLASANRAPDSGRLELLQNYLTLREVIAARELTFLHSRKFDPAVQVNRWLPRIHANAHHHVVLEQTQDFQRLVRLLTGSATGLVLSGGGARGFAHIGVIRALQEKGISIDVIGGT